MQSSPSNLLHLAPLPVFISRLRAKFPIDFSGPFRVSRAPARLDVMGGIADECGAPSCQQSLDCAAVAATSARADRLVQIFSFNQYDAGEPFTLAMPLDALADASIEALRNEFSQPGRPWAGRIAGCLKLLHEQRHINLKQCGGLNIAVHSTIPVSAGLRSGAAIEAATMMNLLDHFQVAREAVTPIYAAKMCADIEANRLGKSSRISNQLACWLGEENSLLICDGADNEPPQTLHLPDGVKIIAIDTGIRRPDRIARHAKTRTAAIIAHRLILEKMHELGHAANQTLIADPMDGQLSKLPADDYKRFFRPYLPEEISDDSGQSYRVQQAADHYILEVRRIRNFLDFLQKAAALIPSPGTPGEGQGGGIVADNKNPHLNPPPEYKGRRQEHFLNMAGHLMYASNISYAKDALIGSDECDGLVSMIRQRERDGFYGARLTAIGSGGTVAVLCRPSERMSGAMQEIIEDFRARTGSSAQIFSASTPGAWIAGTLAVE